MKNYLLGCALFLTGLTTSLTANIYNAPQFDQNCCQPCCDSSFNGFYVGGNLGVLTRTVHHTDFDGFSTGEADLSFSLNKTGFTAGLQLGYDWQCCSKLFGLVVDWNWVDINHTRTQNLGGVPYYQRRDNSDWFTTIRGRFGFAVCDALFYVTAGAAVADFGTRTVWLLEPENYTNRDNRHRWGWVAGVGTEFLVWCNWSAGVEVLYMNFNARKTQLTPPSTSLPITYNFGRSDSIFVARFLVNYRFGDLFGGCGCW